MENQGVTIYQVWVDNGESYEDWAEYLQGSYFSLSSAEEKMKEVQKHIEKNRQEDYNYESVNLKEIMVLP